MNKPQYNRIIKIKEHVDKYIESSKKLNKPIDKYLQTVNAFLNDSGKELKFNDTANLIVSFKNSDNRPITSLASGESQIVVILTHFVFQSRCEDGECFYS